MAGVRPHPACGHGCGGRRGLAPATTRAHLPSRFCCGRPGRIRL